MSHRPLIPGLDINTSTLVRVRVRFSARGCHYISRSVGGVMPAMYNSSVRDSTWQGEGGGGCTELTPSLNASPTFVVLFIYLLTYSLIYLFPTQAQYQSAANRLQVADEGGRSDRLSSGAEAKGGKNWMGKVKSGGISGRKSHPTPQKMCSRMQSVHVNQCRVVVSGPLTWTRHRWIPNHPERSCNLTDPVLTAQPFDDLAAAPTLRSLGFQMSNSQIVIHAFFIRFQIICGATLSVGDRPRRCDVCWRKRWIWLCTNRRGEKSGKFSFPFLWALLYKVEPLMSWL